MKTAIIIPQYDRYELTHARLMELYKHAPSDCVVIVVDDASPNLKDGDIKGLKWWQENARPDLPIDCRKNAENLGFGGTCNAGAKTAINTHKAEIVVFLSNDVIVYDDFITPIRNIILEKPRVLIGGQIIDWKAGWNEVMFDGHEMIVPYAAGWLLACTSEVWKELGGFDLRYGKFDFEDVDISTTAHSLGIDLVGLNLSFLRHISGATIASLPINRMAITLENRQKYLTKWEGRWQEIVEGLEKLRNDAHKIT